MEIRDWLRGLGLECYERVFRENAIDVEVLPELSDGDLEKLGVVLGHRKKLLKAIEGLGNPPANGVLSAGIPFPSPAAPGMVPGAERRQLTVMFVDLVGSTELSARLDPEELGELIRAYQNAVTGEIARFEGHVAKYMGDGVLAYFGWPRAHEDDAERAVRSGLAITEAVSELVIPNGERLSARVGIATGLVVVGDLIGEGSAQEQAVVGETPNLAARLQALAEPDAVVIGQVTRRLIGRLFELEDLGPQRLKGFEECVRASQVVGFGAAESRFEAMHAGRLTPLVGREHELGLLLDRWELAKGGEGRVVLLSGEPGIGKSRIARALLKRVESEPHIRLRYYCSPYHANSALYPVIDQLERAADFGREDLPAIKLAKLEALLSQVGNRIDEAAPLTAALLSIPTDGRYPDLTLTPQAQKARTFEVLLGQLEGLAAQQPVLMIFEDAHWVDPTSVELFGLVIDRIQRLPVFLVLTHRPEFAPPWIGYPHVTSLTLGRLGQRQGAAMVERLAGGKSLPEEVLHQILAKTDGVPLFVEELTKTVLESGLLRDAGDRFELIGPLPPLAIPATLRDSLVARLDRLAPVREVAQIGACIGREFAHELLAAVADRPEDQLCAALDQLVASELIFRRGIPPDAIYTLKHALIQDAAYQSLLKSKRQQLHARIAEVLAARFPETVDAQPEILARHLTEAGLTERAVDYWLRAGRRAMLSSATAEAIAHLSSGLELIRNQEDIVRDRQRELALELALGSGCIAAKGFAAPETGAAYVRARELADALGEISQWFAVTYGLCLFHLYRAEISEARAAATELLRSARHRRDRDSLFYAHRACGVSSLPAGRFATARRHLERALAVHDPERHQAPPFVYAFDPVVVCLDYLARTLFLLSHTDQARERSDDALARARSLGHRNTLALPLFFGATQRQWSGDVEGVSQLADELVELAREEAFLFWLAGGRILQGWVLARTGDLEAGIEQMSQAMRGWRVTGAEYLVPYFQGLLAEARLQAGDGVGALRLLDEALARVESSGERWYEAELHRIRGEVLDSLPQSRTFEAKGAFERALIVAHAQQAPVFELRAACALAAWLRDRGQVHEARHLVKASRAIVADATGLSDLRRADELLTSLS